MGAQPGRGKSERASVEAGGGAGRKPPWRVGGNSPAGQGGGTGTGQPGLPVREGARPRSKAPAWEGGRPVPRRDSGGRELLTCQRGAPLHPRPSKALYPWLQPPPAPSAQMQGRLAGLGD